MGFKNIDTFLELGDDVPHAGFWVGVFVGRHGPDDAETCGDLLEVLGHRPYESGKPRKARAEHGPAAKILLPGQR